MLKVFMVGWVVLLAAIILNVAVQRMGIMGWYDFLLRLPIEGKKLFPQMRIIDYAWLFLVYPLLLGGSVQVGDYLHALISGK
jgi:hypothetical protein